VTGATKVPVTTGVTTTGVDFELVQGGLVTGTVCDRIRRTPLVNHPVSLLETHATGPRVVARTRTDRLLRVCGAREADSQYQNGVRRSSAQNDIDAVKDLGARLWPQAPDPLGQE
jgi:hypothetical protein